MHAYQVYAREEGEWIQRWMLSCYSEEVGYGPEESHDSLQKAKAKAERLVDNGKWKSLAVKVVA